MFRSVTGGQPTNGINAEQTHTTSPSPQPSSSSPPANGSSWSEWAASGIAAGRRGAASLYAQVPTFGVFRSPLSPATQENPKKELAKELADPKAMEAFLQTNAAVKIKTSFEGKQKNLVHIAAQYGSPESLEVVLKHVASMSEPEQDKILNAKSSKEAHAMTPLNLAAFVHGRTEAVEILAKTPGVKLDEKNAYGMTPLMSADEGGNTVAFKALLKAGADVNVKDIDGAGVLARAAYKGRSENVKALLEHDEQHHVLELNAQENGGQTAIHWALSESSPSEGHKRAAALLLAREDLDLTLQDNAGKTAFTSFVLSKIDDPNILKSLLSSKDADKFINQPWKGFTPLMLADEVKNEKAFQAILKEPGLGVDVKVKDPSGLNLLARVADGGTAENMKALLAHPGVDEAMINEKTGGQANTPVIIAAMNKNAAVVAVLAQDSRLRSEERNNDGNTAAICAASVGSSDVLKKMVEANVAAEKPVFDLNAKNERNGLSVAHMVAIKGTVEDAKSLLDHGVNFNVGDGPGLTPHHKSALEGNWPVFELLLDDQRVEFDRKTMLQSAVTLQMAHEKGIEQPIENLNKVVERLSESPGEAAAIRAEITMTGGANLQGFKK